LTGAPPPKSEVRSAVISAPIFLPRDEKNARRAFIRGEVRNSFFEYFSLAEAGSSSAQSVIAYMYLLGYVENCDKISEASYWAKKAVASNDAYGHFVLAWTNLESNRFVDGITHMINAAESEFSPALFHLGSFLMHGIILPKDYSQAISLLELAAAKGHRSAETSMNMLYRTGKCGVIRQMTSVFQSFVAPIIQPLNLLLLNQTNEQNLVYVGGVRFENSYREKAMGESVDRTLATKLDNFLKQIESS
jgi:TPR repeat protein